MSELVVILDISIYSHLLINSQLMLIMYMYVGHKN